MSVLLYSTSRALIMAFYTYTHCLVRVDDFIAYRKFFTTTKLNNTKRIMSFQFKWEQLDSQDIKNKLNTIIKEQLSKQEPLIAQSFTYVNIDSLELGSTPPEIEIIDIDDPPAVPIDSNNNNNQQQQQQQRSPIGIDTRSIFSTSSKSSLLDIQSTSSIGLRLAQRGSPSLSSNSMIFAIRQQQQQLQQSQHQQPHSLDSLQRERLPTHICSMNTLHKKKKTSTGELRQSKRRSDWWKARLDLQKKQHINNEITKFDMNDTETSLKFLPPKKTELQEHADDPIDIGYMLGASATRDGGVMMKVHLKYDGNAQIQFSAEVAVNFPCPQFITLPVEAKISRFIFDGVLVVVYRYNEKQRLDTVQVYFEDDQIQNGPKTSPFKDMNLEVKIGAPLRAKHIPDYIPDAKESSVYVDKSAIEGFVRDQAQKLLQQLIFPNVVTVENILTKDLLTRESSTIKIGNQTINL
jgi:hypothetical protein